MALYHIPAVTIPERLIEAATSRGATKRAMRGVREAITATKTTPIEAAIAASRGIAIEPLEGDPVVAPETPNRLPLATMLAAVSAVAGGRTVEALNLVGMADPSDEAPETLGELLAGDPLDSRNAPSHIGVEEDAISGPDNP